VIGAAEPAGADSFLRSSDRISALRAANIAAGSPVDWANETHAAAVSVAYGALPENADADLAGAYADTARSVVDSQLLRAGLRLAALLNAALK
jgi:S1/P1 Nuclease